jgi:hypothetical protein
MRSNFVFIAHISGFIASCLISALVFGDSASSAADVIRLLRYAAAVSDQDRDEAELIFRRAKSSLESITSGKFRAVGKSGWAEKSGDPIVSNDSELFCVFDFARNQLRFDREQMILNSDEQAAAKDERQLVIGRQVISNDRRLDWNSFVPNEIRVTRSETKIGSVAQPFDIRTLGSAGIISLSKNISLADTFAKMAEQQIVSVERTSNGLRVIEWKLSSEQAAPIQFIASKRVWFDDAQGGCPVRFEVLQTDSGKDIVHEKSRIVWKKVSDVWVPSKSMVGYGPRGGETELAEYAYQWESVNEPVSDEFFTAKGMKPAGRVKVIDRREAAPVDLETLKD